MSMNRFHAHRPRGFTIFFAMLVTSLALAIGLSIYDLTSRELDLSATANQSQYAIYAADTGAECALYWDSKCSLGACSGGSAFATSSASVLPSAGIMCNGQDIAAGAAPLNAPWSMAKAGGSATTTFWLSLGSAASSSCVMVEVGKQSSPVQTVILSHGYNTCTQSPSRVERALQVNY